jgi:hypothetical protein
VDDVTPGTKSEFLGVIPAPLGFLINSVFPTQVV